MNRLALVIALVVLALGAGCHTLRPSELPREEPWIVAVKSCRLPTWMAWYTRFAQHSWIDVKAGDEEHWRRIEVSGETSGVDVDDIGQESARCDWRWSGSEVRTLTTIVGARAQTIAASIDEHAKSYDEFFKQHYKAWPGPNSNTLIQWLAGDIPELACTLDHNALGKDYTSSIYLGPTTSKTGFRFDAYVMGFALALQEGIEMHLLGLDFGLQFWPPRLQLPALPELPWPHAPRGSERDIASDPLSAHFADAIAGAEIVEVRPLTEGQHATGLMWTDVETPTIGLVVGSVKPATWVGLRLTLIDPCDEAPHGGARAEIRAHAPGLNKGNAAWTELFVFDERSHFRSIDYGIVGGGVRASVELARDARGGMRVGLRGEWNAEL